MIRVIFGGTARQLGRFGPVQPGDVLEMSEAEAAAVAGDSNFAVHPDEFNLGLHNQQAVDISDSTYEADADDDRKLLCIQAGGAHTLTLPAEPTLGMFLHVWDRQGAEANPITVDPGEACVCTLLQWIDSVTVADPGTGFTSIPTVEFDGDGVGAAGTAKLKAVAVEIEDAGTGYEANDVLTISGGTSTSAITVTVLTVGGSGDILTCEITTAGSYSALPTNPASVTGGGGTGATFNITWGVASVTMTEKGFGYTEATAAVTGGGGEDAELTPVLANAKRVLNQDGDKMRFHWDGTFWQER